MGNFFIPSFLETKFWQYSGHFYPRVLMGYNLLLLNNFINFLEANKLSLTKHSFPRFVNNE